MKRKYVIVFAGLCLLCMSVANVYASDDLITKIKGKWEITVPDAPEGFNQYNAEFLEKDGNIVMNFKGGDLEIKDQKLILKDGKLTTNIYVGEYVQIVIWDEKGELKGTADTSMGKLPFILKKKK